MERVDAWEKKYKSLLFGGGNAAATVVSPASSQRTIEYNFQIETLFCIIFIQYLRVYFGKLNNFWWAIFAIHFTIVEYVVLVTFDCAFCSATLFAVSFICFARNFRLICSFVCFFYGTNNHFNMH